MTHAEATRPVSNRYVVLALLFIVYALNFIDRQILGILAPAIKDDLRLTDAELGTLGGLAFALFYTTLAVPIAWLADRWNRTWIITIALTIWSGFTALCGYASSYTQLFFARVGVGVGEAGGVAPSYSLIADYFAPKDRARAMAIYSFGIPVGSAAGIAIGGAVASMVDWRAAFIVVGLAGVALAPFFRMLVREPKRGALDANAGAARTPGPKFGFVSLALILVALAFFIVGYAYFVFKPEPLLAPLGLPAQFAVWFYAGVLVAGGVIGAAVGSRLVGSNKASFWFMSFGAACSSIMGYGALFWIPSFLVRSYDFTLQEAAYFFSAVLLIGGVAGVWLGGYFADKLGARSKRAFTLVPATAFILTAPCYALGMLAPSPALAFFLFLLPTACSVVWLGPVIAAMQHMAAAHVRTTASALFLFINNLIGLGLGPLIIGALSDSLTARFADEALRYSILGGSSLYVLAAILMFAASRFIERDWVD